MKLPNLEKVFSHPELRIEEDKSRRLHVTCPSDDPLRPKYFFIRIAPVNLREGRPYNDLYRRDTFLRLKIFPLMNSIYEEQRTPAEIRFAAYSKCIDFTLDEFEECMILEDDERIHNMVRYDKTVSMEPAVIKLVLSNLGKFHAIGYGLLRYKYMQMREPKLCLKDIFVEATTEQGDLPRLLKLCEDLSGTPIFQADKVIHGKLQSLKRDFRISIKKDAINEVIIQGITCTSDILIKYVGATPSAIIFPDWQFSRMGSQSVDLMVFLYCFLDESNIGCFKEYLNYYFEQFLLHGRYIGITFASLYTFEDLQHDLFGFSRYASAVIILSLYKTHVASHLQSIREDERKAYLLTPDYKTLFDAYAKRVFLVLKHMSQINIL